MIKFPASAFPGTPSAEGAINHAPIHLIDRKTQPHPTLGGTQHTFRLSITPWNLQRIIQAANELGLKGKQVRGFAYDDISETIYIAPGDKQPE